MTNTTTLLSDAENRIQAGDETGTFSDYLMSSGCADVSSLDVIVELADRYGKTQKEAGRLAGVADGKREVIGQLIKQSSQFMVSQDESGEFFWYDVAPNDSDGWDELGNNSVDSLIEYLEQQR